MSHKKADRYADLELQSRAEIIGGLRDRGMPYQQIAKTLGIPVRRVEEVLGEVAALCGSGYGVAEAARIVGLPRSTAYRLVGQKKNAGLSARKADALSGLSHMHGMQLDVLAQFLGIGLNHTYVLVAELQQAKMVHPLKAVQAGPKWVYPTRETAARYLGWRPREWEPPLMYANHYRAVAQARIMLVGREPGWWVSERVLRRRAEGAVAGPRGRIELSTGRAPKLDRPHVHDGRFLRVVRGGQEWWAVEVELSTKTVAAMDTALRGAVRAVRDSAQELEPCVGLLYLCRSAAVIDGVEAAADRLPRELAALDFQLVVRDFDDEWNQFLIRRTAAGRPQLHIARAS